MCRNLSFTARSDVSLHAAMRSRHLIPVLVTVLVMTACGKDDRASSPAGAVRAYNDAVADGDGERACGYLDPAAQEELRQSTQGDARKSCPDVIDLLAAFYDDTTKNELRKSEVAASQQGDSAAARLTAPDGFGGPGRSQTIQLRREGDSWKITSLGLAIEPAPGAP